jgi:hypothetical protein
MKAPLLLLSAALLAALPVAAHAKIERVVEKTFTVKPGGQVTVETSGGNITVQTTTDEKATVVAKEKIRASSEAEADELLKDLTLTIEQNGDEILAKAKLDHTGWGRQPVQVDFVVTVPASFRATVKTSGGDVKIGDLQAKVNARTSGGNVRLGKLGSDVDASTSGGDMSLVECTGSVHLSTSGGNIHVERAVGPTDVSTSGGNIDIGSVEGTVHADTSGGNVRAQIRGPLKGDCKLGTSGGQVRVVVDKTAAFDLDAATSGGGVDAAGLTITIEKGGSGKSRLAGKVNGGGPLLKLRTSGGDIDIESR